MKTMKRNVGWARIAAVLAALVWVMTSGITLAGNVCTWNGSWSPLPANTDDAIVVSSGGNLTWSNTMPATVASWTRAAGYTGR